MDVATLRVGVLAANDEQEREIEAVLRFSGIEPSPLEVAQVAISDGGQSADLPVIQVGSDGLPGPNVVASIPALRYHSLMSALHEAHTLMRDQIADEEQLPTVPELVGHSSQAVTLRSMIHRAAVSSVPVLICGERGCGKEQAARAIHNLSEASQGAFVPLDCAAIPEELIESELFGHERGAFSGALTTKIGRLELAAQGTVFLHHVEALSYPVQVKLLRALQDGAFSRVGAEALTPLSARVICASDADMEELVRVGEFREDLYYQISTLPIQVAPLRDRPEDVSPVVECVLAMIEQTQNISLRLSIDVLDVLRVFSWPGNVRELVNLLHRLSIQFRGEVVTTADLPPKVTGTQPAEAPEVTQNQEDAFPQNVRLPVNGLDLKDYLARLEQSLIEQALDDTGAVVARAADRLHIRRTTLVEKMRKYGITRS